MNQQKKLTPGFYFVMAVIALTIAYFAFWGYASFAEQGESLFGFVRRKAAIILPVVFALTMFISAEFTKRMQRKRSQRKE